MKNISHFGKAVLGVLPHQSLFFLGLLISLTSIFIVSCRREIDIPVSSLNAKPSAAATASATTSPVGGDKITFVVDLFVADKNGRFVQGLNQDNFNISDNAYTYQLIDVSKAGLTAKAGGYSAMLLLDQSGSISSSDPENLRIDASKIFLSNLGAEDYAALSSFTTNYSNYFRLHSGFTNQTDRMKRSLDTLSNSVGGGTPLYSTTVQAVNYTAQKGITSNKAVIVFTDGENTESGSLSDATAAAIQQKIPLFTVGLSTSINSSVLAQMASETGGAFFYAKDAGQLISSFGTLGNLLRGQGEIYRTTWSVSRSSGKWAVGQIISSTIQVTLFDGSVIEVPFWLRVK